MPDQFWACAQTLGGREAYAAERLEDSGFTVFAPKIETRRSVEPLFRGYVFALVIEGHWLKINHTFGVIGVIRFGLAPARVPDAEIEALRSRMDATGIIRLPPSPPPKPRCVIKPGTKVKIISGAFTGLAGIYQGMTTRQRELVLLSVLGGQRSVAIPSASISVQ
jgi:transcription antitermination factor NusG